MSDGAIPLERRELQPRGQATAIVGATTVSVIWGAWTHQMIPDKHIQVLPDDAWWGWICGFIGVLYLLFIATSADGVASWFRNDQAQDSRPSRFGIMLARIQHVVVVVVLIVITIGCVVILAGFTVPTGGTIHSPYRDSLMALALLSPFIARQWFTPIAVLAMVAVAYICFSEIVDSEVPVGVEVPVQVHALTTLVTAAVAIGVATLVRVYERPRRVEIQAAATLSVTATAGSITVHRAGASVVGDDLRVLRRPAGRTVEIIQIRADGGGFKSITAVRVVEKGNEPVVLSAADLVNWLIDDGRNRAVVRGAKKSVSVLVFSNGQGRWLRTWNGVNWTDQLQTLPRF
jgi:hypothetical protein